jgi:hypothetical protein
MAEELNSTAGEMAPIETAPIETGSAATQPSASEPASSEKLTEKLTEKSSATASTRKTSDAARGGKVDRPFRVKLRGSVLVLVRLPNKRDVRAAFHQLSVTGGVVHLEKPLDEKLVVELVFHINGATIREKAQMLFPMWATQGWMQPFRFVEMTDASSENLDANLKIFLGEAVKGAAGA